ncbi:hypothetical protein HMPREF9099_01435 [Lachnospiraceae bacterium oral taxon 082 str. F0431]|nr:hypothetical protein HMPREF9099_01435 [Lachnospiraceae bacterium oral taxon 082 str. F0431]
MVFFCIWHKNPLLSGYILHNISLSLSKIIKVYSRFIKQM